MHVSGELEFRGIDHPKQAVRQAGFPLDHPYVEQCWSAVVGPTSTLVLRRMPVLWRESEPAVVRARDFSQSLGLGTQVDNPRARVWQIMERLRQFGFAQPLGDVGGDGRAVVYVYRTAKPVPARLLVSRLPQWSRDAHERLLTEHMADLAAAPPIQSEGVGNAGSPDAGTGIPDTHGRLPDAVASLQGRLDHLQQLQRGRDVDPPALR